MKRPIVFIRTDSSVQIGSGHVIRCLALADELRRRGADVRFISRELPGNLIPKVEQHGYPVARLPAPVARPVDAVAPTSWLGVTPEQDADETLAAIDTRGDWLVVDHYGLDAGWERRIRSRVDRVFVIDDLADRPHDADVLLDQNYRFPGDASPYDDRVPATCRVLLGPQFAVLQPVYRYLRETMLPRAGRVRRVFVFFGAYDAAQSVLKVLDALLRPAFAALEIDVVPGNSPELAAAVKALARGSESITVHDSPQSLAYLLARADLAIGACGTTTWERACLGVPSLVATIADNQVATAKALTRGGYIRLAGPSASLSAEDWATELATLTADPALVASLSSLSMALTDGHGVGRVASVMMGRTPAVLAIRKATPADEALLLRWANDPEVRRQSFAADTIPAEAHGRWFAARLADANCDILIAMDAHGLPVGQVRFSVDATSREALIHVSVDPALRGLGHGAKLLPLALQWFGARNPGYTAVAEVLVGNEASRRMFLAAGFAAARPRRPESLAFELRLPAP